MTARRLPSHPLTASPSPLLVTRRCHSSPGAYSYRMILVVAGVSADPCRFADRSGAACTTFSDRKVLIASADSATAS